MLSEKRFCQLFEDRTLRTKLVHSFLAGTFHTKDQTFKSHPVSDANIPDLIQETFVLLWRKRADFKMPKKRHNITGWLYNTVLRRAAEVARRNDIDMFGLYGTREKLSVSFDNPKFVSYNLPVPDDGYETEIGDLFRQDERLQYFREPDLCLHHDKPRYCRGMCETCYRAYSKGKTTKPQGMVNTCGHADRRHWAKNMCAPCYRRSRRKA